MKPAKVGLWVFAHLPRRVRRVLVRFGKPAYTVGAMAVIVEEGQVLLARQSYRAGWALPGGLLDRDEVPEAACVRELWEEVGVAVVLEDEPRVAVDPTYRRVDVVFRGRLASGVVPADAHPVSAEIVEAGWFPLTDLPQLQAEAAHAMQLAGYTAEVSRWLRRTPPAAPSGRRGGAAS